MDNIDSSFFDTVIAFDAAPEVLLRWHTIPGCQRIKKSAGELGAGIAGIRTVLGCSRVHAIV